MNQVQLGPWFKSTQVQSRDPEFLTIPRRVIGMVIAMGVIMSRNAQIHQVPFTLPTVPRVTDDWGDESDDLPPTKYTETRVDMDDLIDAEDPTHRAMGLEIERAREATVVGRIKLVRRAVSLSNLRR